MKMKFKDGGYKNREKVKRKYNKNYTNDTLKIPTMKNKIIIQVL